MEDVLKKGSPVDPQYQDPVRLRKNRLATGRIVRVELDGRVTVDLDDGVTSTTLSTSDLEWIEE